MSALHFETDQVRHFVLSCVMWDKKKAKENFSNIMTKRLFTRGIKSYLLQRTVAYMSAGVLNFLVYYSFWNRFACQKTSEHGVIQCVLFCAFSHLAISPSGKMATQQPPPPQKKGKWLYSRCPHGKLNISWNYHLFKVRISPPPLKTYILQISAAFLKFLLCLWWTICGN